MPTTSHIADTLEHGVVLEVTLDGFQFFAYVAISEPDVDHVADIVPVSRFEDGDVHVAAIGSPHDAPGQIEDIVFNMNPGDCVVFLCADPSSYNAALDQFGQHPPRSDSSHIGTEPD